MDYSDTLQPRLLLLAHSCNPEIGSEPAMGWNRALEAAKQFRTWVLCDEEYNRAAIERYFASHDAISNLQFVYVPPSRIEQRMMRLPGMFYPSYNLWHRRAFRIAEGLHSQLQFDLVHQLNLCGFREPGYLWKLDAPFVWGPVGGAQNYPWRFMASAGITGAVGESIRSLLNLLQMRFSRRVGTAARKAAVVLVANSTNARNLSSRCGRQPQIALEVGVRPPPLPPLRNFRHAGPLRILWSGVLEHRKALHLLLEALAALPQHVRYELRILGRGPLAKRWQKMARRLKIETNCQWLGWLDRPQAIAQYEWADVFAFTSLRDTTGTVVLEALAAGTPVLCFDHQGMADVMTDQCGVKLPVTTPAAAIAGLRDTLIRWHDNREELESLSREAIARAEHYSWQRQGERMAEVYRQMLREHGSIDSIEPETSAHQAAANREEALHVAS